MRVAGCDEVGRGPLAGPLVAAAVVLPAHGIEGLDDSKKLTRIARERLAERIHAEADVALVRIPPEDVDRLNVYKASIKAMTEAVHRLGGVEFVLSDAVPIEEMPHTALIKGDQKSASIAAASIVAKVSRDAEMRRIGERYPEFGFEIHKGYATPAHLEAIETHGVCSAHRRSFAPVKRRIEKQMRLHLEVSE